MKLVVGGAYQGKLDFATNAYNIPQERCYNCSCELDFSFELLNKLEEYVLELVEKGENPMEFFKDNLEKFKDKVVIITDISGGVVPIDPLLRKWREEVGRVGVFLAINASEVTRVFCGIPTRLK